MINLNNNNVTDFIQGKATPDQEGTGLLTDFSLQINGEQANAEDVGFAGILQQLSQVELSDDQQLASASIPSGATGGKDGLALVGKEFPVLDQAGEQDFDAVLADEASPLKDLPLLAGLSSSENDASSDMPLRAFAADAVKGAMDPEKNLASMQLRGAQDKAVLPGLLPSSAQLLQPGGAKGEQALPLNPVADPLTIGMGDIDESALNFGGKLLAGDFKRGAGLQMLTADGTPVSDAGKGIYAKAELPMDTIGNKDFLLPEQKLEAAAQLNLRGMSELQLAEAKAAGQLQAGSAESSPLSPLTATDPRIKLESQLPPTPLPGAEFSQGLNMKRDFTPNLAMRIQWMFQQALSSAEIMLDPPELGPMTVKVQQNNGETNILFQTNNQAAREALDENMSRLKQMLEEQGLSLGEAQVQQQGKNAGDDSGQQNANGSSTMAEEEANETITPSVISRGLVDVYS